MKWNKFAVLITFLGLVSLNTGCEDSSSLPVEKIAFGSCSRESSEQQMWAEILENQPKIFIWGGDNIYGDSDDMMILREKYDKQKSHPLYTELRNSATILGTWDDHDYGLNDGGREYSMKSESKKEFMRFFDLEESDPINSHEGVYNFKDVLIDGSSVRVILLDTRYFRDSIISDTSGKARYTVNLEGDVLGEDQWIWLESMLKGSEARFNIIVSSIQLLSEEHGYEKWANFPQARKRMLKLLEKYPRKKVLVLSGDRHIAEFSRYDNPNLNYPLIDFTSSGLTHSWSEASEEINKYRMGEMVFVPNFGVISFDWDHDKILLEVHGKENILLVKQEINYQNL